MITVEIPNSHVSCNTHNDHDFLCSRGPVLLCTVCSAIPFASATGAEVVVDSLNGKCSLASSLNKDSRTVNNGTPAKMSIAINNLRINSIMI